MENWGQQVSMRLQSIYERMVKEGIESQAATLSLISKAIMDIQDTLRSSAAAVASTEEGGGEIEKSEMDVLGGLLVNKVREIAIKTLLLEQEAAAQLRMDLTLVDYIGQGSQSKWFLFDEILMSVGHAEQFYDFLDFLGAFPVAQLPASKAFYQGVEVVKQLQNLNNSFFSVIFQEGLKCFQKEEPSGERMIHN